MFEFRHRWGGAAPSHCQVDSTARRIAGEDFNGQVGRQQVHWVNCQVGVSVLANLLAGWLIRSSLVRWQQAAASQARRGGATELCYGGDASFKSQLVANVICLGPWLCELGQWCYCRFLRNLLLAWQTAAHAQRKAVACQLMCTIASLLGQWPCCSFIKGLVQGWQEASVMGPSRTAAYLAMSSCPNWHADLCVFGCELQGQPGCAICGSQIDVVGCDRCGVACSRCLQAGEVALLGTDCASSVQWHQFKAKLLREQLMWRRVHGCAHGGMVDMLCLGLLDSQCGVCRAGTQTAIVMGCSPCGFTICNACLLKCNESPPPALSGMGADNVRVVSDCYLPPELRAADSRAPGLSGLGAHLSHQIENSAPVHRDTLMACKLRTMPMPASVSGFESVASSPLHSCDNNLGSESVLDGSHQDLSAAVSFQLYSGPSLQPAIALVRSGGRSQSGDVTVWPNALVESAGPSEVPYLGPCIERSSIPKLLLPRVSDFIAVRL